VTISASITVLIPAYRAQATIYRALASVRAQTLQPAQVLIIDDGSPVPLVVDPQQLAPTPVSLIRLPQNRGSSGALNHGISHVTTDWIAFLDADDSWHEDKLAQQMAFVEQEPDTILVATGLRFLDATGQKLMDVATTKLPDDDAKRFASLMEDCVIGKPSVLVRTKALLHIGGFDEQLIVGEDQHLWLRIAAKFPVAVVPDILTFAHDTPGSLTKRRDIAPDYLWRKVIAPLLAQYDQRLSLAQRRRIIGARCQQAAVAHLSHGFYLQALGYLWRSTFNGYQTLQNISYMLTPLKNWIKRIR
jgi:glycosyltransferase involved in cell wall biosynthesis